MIPIFFRYAQLMVVCGLLCSPPAMAGYTRINKDNPNDPMAAHIYRLDNGLTVYLTENHEKPRIYTEIAVRVGSKNDPSNNTGMAHYQEHLMSKGNHRLATIDFEKESPTWTGSRNSMKPISRKRIRKSERPSTRRSIRNLSWPPGIASHGNTINFGRQWVDRVEMRIHG